MCRMCVFLLYIQLHIRKQYIEEHKSIWIIWAPWALKPWSLLLWPLNVTDTSDIPNTRYTSLYPRSPLSVMMMMMMMIMMIRMIRMIMWMWDMWDTGNVAASFCSHASQPIIATVPADETVEPKDLVLLLPLLIIPIKSSKRKEDRDWNLLPFAIALGRSSGWKQCDLITPPHPKKWGVLKIHCDQFNHLSCNNLETMSKASLESGVLRVLWTWRSLAIRWSAEHSLVAEAKTSQSISRSKPPNPRCSLRYPTQESLWSNPSIYEYLSVFHFLQIASNRYTDSYNVHTGGMGSKSWFGSPGHLSSFSFFTSNNRKTASISSGRSKPLLSSSCRPESDGYRKSIVNLEVFLKKRYLISTWILLGFNQIITLLKSTYISKPCANRTKHKEMATINLDWLIGFHRVTRRQGRLVYTSNPLSPDSPGWNLE